MKKIKIMMIDDNINLVEMVKEFFKEHELIEFCFSGNSKWPWSQKWEGQYNHVQAVYSFQQLNLSELWFFSSVYWVLQYLFHRGIM